MELNRYLDDLESRIDPNVEEELIAQWRDFSELRFHGDVFRPRRRRPFPSPITWPKVSINRAQESLDAMVLDQFGGCSATLAGDSGNVMMVRANYGTPILAMPFGTELFIMPEETNTLPNCKPLGTAGVQAMLQRGTPSADHAYLQKVYEAGRRFSEIAGQYPKIGRYVAIYHPDLQGPMDIVELVWGSEVFTALLDQPDMVHQLLKMATDLYLQVMRKWTAIAPLSFHGLGPHWGMMHRGGIMLRDDSAMNLSPAMFREFIQPYDQRLLAEFGGGAIHACGRVDHFVEALPDMPGLHAFNMAQAHLNDLNKVFSHTIDRGIVLIGIAADALKDVANAGRNLRGRVHCA